MEEVRTIEQQIKDLHKSADKPSYRIIAKTLNISLGKVQRTLKGVSGVSPSVSKCIDTERKGSAGEQGGSVADLKTKFNSILRDIYNKIKSVTKRQDDMEEEFNERFNKVISYHISNTIEGLIEKKLKSLGGGIKG